MTAGQVTLARFGQYVHVVPLVPHLDQVFFTARRRGDTVATGRAFRGDPPALGEARRIPYVAVRWETSPALEMTCVLATQAAPRSTRRDSGSGQGRKGSASVRHLSMNWIFHP